MNRRIAVRIVRRSWLTPPDRCRQPAAAADLQAGRRCPATAAARGGDARPALRLHEWKHFTIEDGLPNDHIFAVKADGDDGLDRHRGRPGLLDKKTGKIRSLEGEGRPALAGRHRDRRRPEDRRRLARPVRRRPGPLQRRPLRPLPPAQQRPGQRRGLRHRRGERQRLGRHHRRRQPLQHEDRRVDHLHREERAMEEIWNYGVCLRQGQGLPGRVGQRRAGVRREDRATGRSYLDPDGEMEIDLYRDDGIIHVITTGVSHVDDVALDLDLLRQLPLRRPPLARLLRPRNRPAQRLHQQREGPQRRRGWFATTKAWAWSPTSPPTPVAYTRDPQDAPRQGVRSTATASCCKTFDMERGVPHNFIIDVDFDGNDVWVATAQGLGWGIGEGLLPGASKANPRCRRPIDHRRRHLASARCASSRSSAPTVLLAAAQAVLAACRQAVGLRV